MIHAERKEITLQEEDIGWNFFAYLWSRRCQFLKQQAYGIKKQLFVLDEYDFLRPAQATR